MIPNKATTCYVKCQLGHNKQQRSNISSFVHFQRRSESHADGFRSSWVFKNDAHEMAYSPAPIPSTNRMTNPVFPTSPVHEVGVFWHDYITKLMAPSSTEPGLSPMHRSHKKIASYRCKSEQYPIQRYDWSTRTSIIHGPRDTQSHRAHHQMPVLRISARDQPV